MTTDKGYHLPVCRSGSDQTLVSLALLPASLYFAAAPCGDSTSADFTGLLLPSLSGDVVGVTYSDRMVATSEGSSGVAMEFCSVYNSSVAGRKSSFLDGGSSNSGETAADFTAAANDEVFS